MDLGSEVDNLGQFLVLNRSNWESKGGQKIHSLPVTAETYSSANINIPIPNPKHQIPKAVKTAPKLKGLPLLSGQTCGCDLYSLRILFKLPFSLISFK